jgi:acyl-CoA thioesterase
MFSLKQTDQEDQIYNGQLISQAMYCGYQTVPQLFDINSFHSYFVRKGLFFSSFIDNFILQGCMYVY